jgi:hypothetical protein
MQGFFTGGHALQSARASHTLCSIRSNKMSDHQGAATAGDVPQNTQDLTVFVSEACVLPDLVASKKPFVTICLQVQNLLQQMVLALQHLQL